jgi:hypothetical protein
MGIIDELPYPFHQPEAQQLWRVLTNLYPSPFDATTFAQRFGVDPLDLPQNLPPRHLWYVLLQKTTIQGTTRDMVIAARDEHLRSPHAPFLAGLLDDISVPVSPEPMTKNGSDFDDSISKPEALLFYDDLTIPAGEVTNLIATLGELTAVSPAVCLLRVTSATGSYFGTGFRIGADFVLTNEHVLFPDHVPALTVRADFAFDVDAAGNNLPVVSLNGDTLTIVGEPADDWAVIRVRGMDPAWPTLDIAAAPPLRVGDRAYIVQHPGGQLKRIGFVRNTITNVTDKVVHYMTDTQPGSSGAPVFDAAARIIAVHHRGGQPMQVAGKPPLTKNEGIRISRVHERLTAKGVRP